jgi:hypothetical protein
MAAKSSKGVTVCISSAAASAANNITPTAIVAVAATTTARAAVKVTATPLPAVGDAVHFKDVGFASLNNKSFIVTKVDVADFEIGNLVLGTGTLAATPVIEHYLAAEMTCLCLSSFSISRDTPGTISTGTFCDPTASIPESATSAGTVSFAGFVDINSKDYAALLDAVEDSKSRIVRVTFPNNGYLVMPVTFSSITWDIPLSGAIGFSGSGSLGTNPVHVW